MRAHSLPAFFERIAALLVDNPPRPADAPMMDRLAELGVRPGHAPRWSLPDRWALALGRAIAERVVQRATARTIWP